MLNDGDLIYNGSPISRSKKVLTKIPESNKKMVFKRKDDFLLNEHNQGKKILKELHEMVKNWK